MTRCKEFYERFDELRHIAKEIKGYCEVDAQKSIQRFGEYIDFCTKYDLRPFGLIPEGALRPLIAGRNSDIAAIVVEQVKTRMKSDNPKFAQITNKVVRQLIAETRRNPVDTPLFPDKKYRCLESPSVVDAQIYFGVWSSKKALLEDIHEKMGIPTYIVWHNQTCTEFLVQKWLVEELPVRMTSEVFGDFIKKLW
jgi:hypothetical protein